MCAYEPQEQKGSDLNLCVCFCGRKLVRLFAFQCVYVGWQRKAKKGSSRIHVSLCAWTSSPVFMCQSDNVFMWASWRHAKVNLALVVWCHHKQIWGHESEGGGSGSVCVYASVFAGGRWIWSVTLNRSFNYWESLNWSLLKVRYSLTFPTFFIVKNKWRINGNSSA